MNKHSCTIRLQLVSLEVPRSIPNLYVYINKREIAYRTERKDLIGKPQTNETNLVYSFGVTNAQFFVSFHDYLFEKLEFCVVSGGLVFTTVVGKGQLTFKDISFETTIPIKLYKGGNFSGKLSLVVLSLGDRDLPGEDQNWEGDETLERGSLVNRKKKPPTEVEILRSFKYFLSTFLESTRLGKMRLLLSLHLVRKVHQRRERISLQQYNENLVQNKNEIYRALMLTVATYGWRGLFTCSPTRNIVFAPLKTNPNLRAASSYLGIPQEEFRIFCLKSRGLYSPKYFVCYDETLSSVVVAVRGTMEGKDILTDLAMDYHPWRGGYVHYGMLQTAENLFEEVEEMLFKLVLEKQTQKILLVGHSLGGGIASLLTILLLEKIEREKLPVLVFNRTFGAAASMSDCLIRKYAGFGECFIYKNDIVPFLSYGSFLKLKQLLLNLGGVSSFSTFLFGSALKNEKLVSSAEAQIQEEQVPSLYPAERIFRITQEKTTGRFMFYCCAKKEFQTIKLHRNMFYHHLPSTYVKILEKTIPPNPFLPLPPKP